MSFKISAIVNTLNRQDILTECLHSLAVQDNLAEIIVVDDGSNPAVVKHKLMDKLIRLNKTVGVAESRNIGAKAASKGSTHLFFTDDDIFLDPNCFNVLCSPQIWSDKKVAATGGSVPNMNVPAFIENKWRYVIRPMAINYWGEIVDLSEYWVVEWEWWLADHIRGGNQLIDHGKFVEVAGFPTCYGPGGFREETDFCLMLREKGYKLMFNPCARAYHYKRTYGGVREHTSMDAAYDKIWRERWAPKHFLGEERKYPPILAVKAGRRT